MKDPTIRSRRKVEKTRGEKMLVSWSMNLIMLDVSKVLLLALSESVDSLMPR